MMKSLVLHCKMLGGGGRGFDPGSGHTKDLKMIPVATVLGAQHYNKNKTEIL